MTSADSLSSDLRQLLTRESLLKDRFVSPPATDTGIDTGIDTKILKAMHSYLKENTFNTFAIYTRIIKN